MNDKNTSNTEEPLYTLNDVPDGSYRANPVFCGFTKSSNKGARQFAIECKLHVSLDNGKVIYVNATKFGGVDTDEGAEYAMQDAENCGCNVELPVEKWEVDPKVTVIAKIVTDEYGKKLKSIFADKPLEAGFLIKKNAIPEEEKELTHAELNGRFAALRANRASGATTTSAEKPKTTAAPDPKANKSRARTPI